jgi:hypothetical protein
VFDRRLKAFQIAFEMSSKRSELEILAIPEGQSSPIDDPIIGTGLYYKYVLELIETGKIPSKLLEKHIETSKKIAD